MSSLPINKQFFSFFRKIAIQNVLKLPLN